MTNDEAKAHLQTLPTCGLKLTTKDRQALDIALWLLEREHDAVRPLLEKVASSKHLPRERMQQWHHAVIEAACAVEKWEREHPRPGS